MAEITKNISAIPAGITTLHLYEGFTSTGLFALVASIPVTQGQTSITFNAVDDRYYKFRLQSAGGALSDYSSAWFNGVATVDYACLVEGRCIKPDGSGLAGVTITATVRDMAALANSEKVMAGTSSVVSAADGTWSMSLVRNAALVNPDVLYNITLKGAGYDESVLVKVPDVQQAMFTDLMFGGNISRDVNLTMTLDEECLVWRPGDIRRIVFNVTEADNLVNSLNGCTAYIKVTKDGSDVVNWAVADLAKMEASLLFDTANRELGKYMAQCKITDPSGETTCSSLQKFTLKV